MKKLIFKIKYYFFLKKLEKGLLKNKFIRVTYSTFMPILNHGDIVSIEKELYKISWVDNKYTLTKI